uniref:non-specific serine/threonine protein kinase n=1 Tax=Aegilops tauschii TaxID=37682 RepID=M8BL30_AEGTA
MNGKSKKSKDTPLLGKYELGRLLGRGTFAKVYLAHPVTGGEPVAVKVIDKAEVMGMEGMAPRVLREVVAMRRLRHPGVLRLHEAHRREYEVPPWVSPPARRLVHRLLDPNPATRVSVEALAATHPWFVKRSLSLDSQLDGLLDGQPERALAFRAPAVNAFDIISMSQGLDLSGLFGGSKSREKRFMTTASPEQTLEQLSRASGKLGYVVVGTKGVGCQRRPPAGRPAISVGISELVPPLMLVEMRLEMDDGDGEVQVFGWDQLRVELGDVLTGKQLIKFKKMKGMMFTKILNLTNE